MANLTPGIQEGEKMYMIQLEVDSKSLIRYLYDKQKSETKLFSKQISKDNTKNSNKKIATPYNMQQDEGYNYGIHALLRKMFREKAPQPWRLLGDQSTNRLKILGYTQHNIDALKLEFNKNTQKDKFDRGKDKDEIDRDNLLANVLFDRFDEKVAIKPFPEIPSGTMLSFQVLCCPVGRESRSGREKDLYILRNLKDREMLNKEDRIPREEIYKSWLIEKLERDGATSAYSIEVLQYRRKKIWRKSFTCIAKEKENKKQEEANNEKRRSPEKPEVLLGGKLVVQNPTVFRDNLMARGVGRHTAFGYGMLLLKPA